MTEQRITFETAKLAKEKGFDEIVRHTYAEMGGHVKEIDPPKDSELIEYFTGFYIKSKLEPEQLRTKLIEKAGTSITELHNSMLPNFCYARPTQDLLNRWLREKHGMTVTVAMPITFQTPGIIVSIKGDIMQHLNLHPTTYEEAMEWGLHWCLNRIVL